MNQENKIGKNENQNPSNAKKEKENKTAHRLAELKKKQDQLKAQIQQLEAAEKTRERKRDTRRKILIGAYYLDKARIENTFGELAKLMESYLNRNSDRELFDLEMLPEKSKSLSKE